MNKIKISDSDKRLLIIFFAIVILACSYFFIFNKGMTKASELEAQNEQDSAKVLQMQERFVLVLPTKISHKTLFHLLFIKTI